MSEQPQAAPSAGAPAALPQRPLARRALLGGALTAAGAAAAYAAWGDPLGFLAHGEEGGPDAAAADAAALAKESVRISHLLRRAGFGVSKEEFDRYQQMGLEATIDELLNFAAVDDSEAEALAAQVPVTPGKPGSPLSWWIVRMVNSKRPLQEKMTLFWHGLLTSQISVVKDPTAMVAQNEFFRAHALADFPTILKGISADRAMMVYLDIDGSQKQAPNENYARELMELFSLGVGNFSEQDVREAARAFTGWRVPRRRIDQNVFVLEEPVFLPQRFDNGTKTFLGQSGNFRPDDIVDIIVQQPASAGFITRRLFSFFIYPDPTDEELEPFVAVYNRSGRSIGAVVEALLRSEVFYSPRAYRAIVKSPVEYAIGAIKALGLQGAVGQFLAGSGGPRNPGVLGEMGQVLFEPPNVAGWPGGAAWLNSATLFARLNFINALTGGAASGRAGNQRRPAAPSLPASGLGTAAQALAHYLPLTVDDNLPEAARAALLEYAGGPDVPLTPERLRGLVYLILASPQFHLA